MRKFDFAAVAVLVVGWASGLAPARAADRPPNIVFIIADDLGYGDVGCYGQKRFRTPNIDRLAAEGMRFTAYYSGHSVCAPSRCVLMSGKHPGHAFVRGNGQAKGFPEGQTPVPPGELKLPLLLKKQGYVLGGFGKWGLGPVGSTGGPLRQGFDRWFGYNCQAVAHNYYTGSLWDDDRPFPLDNPKIAAHVFARAKLPESADPNDPKSYARYTGNQYAPDLYSERARAFARANRGRPFFLYYPTIVPHLALQVPEDSLKQYVGKFPETPYKGERGYMPQRWPRAAYAAMIARMDDEIGKLLATVHELGLDDQTIVVFCSDNGPARQGDGGVDTDFFNSSGGLRGGKGSYYEGGFREPCIVRWPGRAPAGSTTDRVCGAEDWLPTFLELIGAEGRLPEGSDGVSFAPTLLGREQKPRAFLYRETPEYGGQQCARVGDWKAVRTNLNPGPRAKDQKFGDIELYNIATDPHETKDVAGERPEVVKRLRAVLEREHVPSPLFPIRALDRKTNENKNEKE